MIVTDASVAQCVLWEYAKHSVQSELYAGEILSQSGKMISGSDYYRLDALFTCREMIAQIIEGKWNKEDYFHG